MKNQWLLQGPLQLTGGGDRVFADFGGGAASNRYMQRIHIAVAFPDVIKDEYRRGAGWWWVEFESSVVSFPGPSLKTVPKSERG